jgi:nucleoside-diphosphate-sugar epimerase
MILVTGGTGFIGGHLLEKLAAEGQAVRCLLRRDPQRALPPGVEAVRGDLTAPHGLEAALRGVDTVIHLAGVTKALRPADYYAGNLRATENLAGALQGRPIRLVHVSSMAAAGPGSALGEDAEPRPVSHYGCSKLEAERVVRALLPDAVIARPPVVYGPRDTDVYQVLKSVAKGIALEISGPQRWFSAIYVGDLAEALCEAARNPRASGRTYYFAHPQPVTWRGLAETAARIMGRRPPRAIRVPYAAAWAVGWCSEAWARMTRRPGIVSRDKIAEARCASWTCDVRRASAELGFEARVTLEAGLAKTLAWYREAGWLTY